MYEVIVEEGFGRQALTVFFKGPENPLLVFGQSVARQVGLDLSKMCTPSSISSVITDFDPSNSFFRSLSLLKCVSGLSDCQNASMHFVAVKVHDTWFMIPNQEHTSVMFAVVGNSQIVSRYFLHGQTLVVILK